VASRDYASKLIDGPELNILKAKVWGVDVGVTVQDMRTPRRLELLEVLDLLELLALLKIY